MRVSREDVPVRIDLQNATVRQKLDFGDANGFGKISVEYFSLSAGTDISSLLQGLEDDLCQSPHWGYIIEGQLTVCFSDGHCEETKSHDLFHWPPGHTVKADKDTKMILFSPQHERSEVIDHIVNKIQIEAQG